MKLSHRFASAVSRAISLTAATLLWAANLSGAQVEGLADGLYAEISTSRGVITCSLNFQQTPLTVTNFVGLAEGTLGPQPRKPFFDGLKFHRVVPDFVVQGGDPLGTGEGGPGYTFADEFVPGLRHDAAGVLSMANDGPDTNGSQFFITLRETNRLNYLHTVFGRVVRGMDVLTHIQAGDAMTVKTLRIGAAAQAFPATPAAFDRLVTKTKKFGDLASAKPEPGPTAHFDDRDHRLPADPPRAKYFNYKLANFERTTGIRIVARILAKSPSAAEDAKAGAYMHALAEKLGAAKRGALAVYFADEDDWRVWIGDDSTTAFLGREPSVTDLTEGAAFHEAKEAFLKATREKGDADFTNQKKSAKPDKPLPAGQQLKLQTDAMLDGLIERLER